MGITRPTRSPALMALHAALAALAVTAPAACMPRAPEGLDSPLPQQRMEAAVLAAGERDTAAIPKLVPLLESDDPAVRLVAIHSLEQITGQTLGYDYAAEEPVRTVAVDRWQAWVEQNAGPASAGAAPADAPTGESAK